MRRQVEELCGLAGVVPSWRDLKSSHGSVNFEEQSSLSRIIYPFSTATLQPRENLLVKISTVLINFCTAAAVFQASGLCCDMFTVLVRTEDYLRLEAVAFSDAAHMAKETDITLAPLKSSSTSRNPEFAARILQVFPDLIPVKPSGWDDYLQCCALAVQFLCLAFMSYTQAHLGPIDPFFLDTAQRKMVLLGCQSGPGRPAINAELVELTCLADMTQQPVLAFSSTTTARELYAEASKTRYDVLTDIVDFLDTCGPG